MTDEQMAMLYVLHRAQDRDPSGSRTMSTPECNFLIINVYKNDYNNFEKDIHILESMGYIFITGKSISTANGKQYSCSDIIINSPGMEYNIAEGVQNSVSR